MKTFTLDEAQGLLPIVESLLNRAIEAKTAAGDLQEEKSGTRIGVGVSGLLECNRECDELSAGQQDEQCAGERTHR